MTLTFLSLRFKIVLPLVPLSMLAVKWSLVRNTLETWASFVIPTNLDLVLEAARSTLQTSGMRPSGPNQPWQRWNRWKEFFEDAEYPVLAAFILFPSGGNHTSNNITIYGVEARWNPGDMRIMSSGAEAIISNSTWETSTDTFDSKYSILCSLHISHDYPQCRNFNQLSPGQPLWVKAAFALVAGDRPPVAIMTDWLIYFNDLPFCKSSSLVRCIWCLRE